MMCDKCAASCAHLFTKICPFHKVRQLRWGNGCGFPPRVDPESQHGVWLANCYFAHDSSGFPILLLFFDAQSGRSCYPLDRHAGPVARTWWRPFPGRGVASPETPAPDRESLPATIAQSIRGGPHPCRLAGALGASNPPSPFRNCTEALDTARASQSFEQAKVPDALLHESPSEARSERTERRSHSCGRRNEAT